MGRRRGTLQCVRPHVSYCANVLCMAKVRNIKYRTLRGVRRSNLTTGHALCMLIGMRESDNLWEIISSTTTPSEYSAKFALNKLLVQHELTHLPYTFLGSMSDESIKDQFRKTTP